MVARQSGQTAIRGTYADHRDIRLQNKVIDLEVAASTPSPTIEPSVHAILLGHSMGGIVAAETLLVIASDVPIPVSPTSSQITTRSAEFTSPSFIFPHVSGIIAFDTPYLGINPRVIAHGAESHYRTASSAWSSVSDVASAFGYGASKDATRVPASVAAPRQTAASAGSTSTKLLTSSTADAAATPTWQRWGKYAMFAGAAGAVAAGGAAAYIKRDALGEGWGWVGSHLEFVNCLARPEELRKRVDRIRRLLEQSARHLPTGKGSHDVEGSSNGNNTVGFKNLITLLGKGAGAPSSPSPSPLSHTLNTRETNVSSGIIVHDDESKLRTFCNLPPGSSPNRPFFEFALNDRATSEVGAHMEMFDRRRNPGYFALADRARELVVQYIKHAEWSGEIDRQHTDQDGGFDGAASDGQVPKLSGQDVRTSHLGDEILLPSGAGRRSEDEMVDIDLGNGHLPITTVGLDGPGPTADTDGQSPFTDLGAAVNDNEVWATGEEAVMVERS